MPKPPMDPAGRLRSQEPRPPSGNCIQPIAAARHNALMEAPSPRAPCVREVAFSSSVRSLARRQPAAGGWRMNWLMPVLAISRRGRVTPWVQLGAGAVSQTGECPQGGSRPDPACVFDLALGGQLATGLRVRLAPAWSFGGEIGYIRGAEVRQRYVTSQRVAIALRWQ